MNNSVYGKTMENARKHRIVQFVEIWHGRYGAKNRMAGPSLHIRIIFNENLVVAIELTKYLVIFNKLFISECLFQIFPKDAFMSFIMIFRSL